MLTLHVSVPIACFRKGMAREYLETEPLPPPATCYGMLLSFVGQADRRRHIGVRVTAGLLGKTETSVVLRTVWRVKDKNMPSGSGQNVRPDFQQLLTGGSFEQPFVELVMYLDSSGEADPENTLEEQVRIALDSTRRHVIARFGGLSLGESTHLVDSISVATPQSLQTSGFNVQRVFLKNDEGSLSLPVWVDHVGSAGTVHVVGSINELPDLSPPDVNTLPRIVSAA
jgi:CRISPR-associated protein Cas5t